MNSKCDERDELYSRAQVIKERRTSDAEELKDIAAKLWRGGLQNINELRRITGLSRGTLYPSLRSRGIEPTDRKRKSHYPSVKMEVFNQG